MMTDVSNKKFFEMSLSYVVENKLKMYFQVLEGNPPASQLYQQIIQEVEKPLITLALKHTKGNKLKAAELLGINRNTLYKKIKELKIGESMS